MQNEESLPPLTVLHCDNHVIGVVKPAGMLVQADDSGDESLLECTREWIRIKYAKPGNVFCGLVHRLDRPASGVVIFARTSKGASRLSEEFRSRRVEKCYRAVLHGPLPDRAGELFDWVQPDRSGGSTRVAVRQGEGTQEARLRYRVLGHADGMTEVEVELITGRKHQIRVQFAHRGHSIVGDFRYGSKTKVLDGHAIALHAARLSIKHPTRDEQIVLEAPPPLHWPMRGGK